LTVVGSQRPVMYVVRVFRTSRAVLLRFILVTLIRPTAMPFLRNRRLPWPANAPRQDLKAASRCRIPRSRPVHSDYTCDRRSSRASKSSRHASSHICKAHAGAEFLLVHSRSSLKLALSDAAVDDQPSCARRYFFRKARQTPVAIELGSRIAWRTRMLS